MHRTMQVVVVVLGLMAVAEVARDNRISSITERQLVFDCQGQLREMLTAAQISGP